MDSACKYISYLKTMEKHIEGTPFAGMFYTAKAFYELKANRDFSKGISLLIKSYNEFENYNDIENMVIRIPQRQHFPRFGAGAGRSHFAMSSISPKFIPLIIKDIRFGNLLDPAYFATKRPFCPISSQVQQTSFPRAPDYQVFL